MGMSLPPPTPVIDVSLEGSLTYQLKASPSPWNTFTTPAWVGLSLGSPFTSQISAT